MASDGVQGLSWTGGRDVVAATVDPPSPEDGWSLVEMAYVGLCGTDLHICAGEHPRARPGLVIGHEVVGRLMESTPALPAGAPVFVNPLLPCATCRLCRMGRPNVCEHLGFLGIDRNGGAAELFLAPTEQLVALPSSLELRLAALVEPVAVAVHAVHRGGPVSGRRVHVLGAGPIGLLVASCAQLAGASAVSISEPAPERAAAVTALGFDLAAATRTATPSVEDRADVVFDCTGHPAASPSVLRWAATGGTVVTVGSYPGVVGLDLQDVMFRELTVIGTRAYTPGDVAEAVALLGQGAIDASRFISDVMALTDGAVAIERLRAGGGLKVLLQGPAT